MSGRVGLTRMWSFPGRARATLGIADDPAHGVAGGDGASPTSCRLRSSAGIQATAAHTRQRISWISERSVAPPHISDAIAICISVWLPPRFSARSILRPHGLCTTITGILPGARPYPWNASPGPMIGRNSSLHQWRNGLPFRGRSRRVNVSFSSALPSDRNG